MTTPTGQFAPQQPQFQPQQPQQQWIQAPVPAKRRNGFGVAALVLGIIGMIFALIPLFGIFVAWPCAILAIVFGGVGMIFAFKGRASKGVTIAGTVLGVIAMIISIAATNSFVNDVSSPSADTAGTVETTDKGTGTGGSDAGTSKGKLNEPVKAGDFTFTATDLDCGATSVGPDGFEEKAQGQYCILDMTVKNDGTESVFLFGSDQKLLDADGRKFSADEVASMYANDDDGSNPLAEEINPGNTAKGSLAFDVPEGVTPVTAELSGGDLFAETIQISLK